MKIAGLVVALGIGVAGTVAVAERIKIIDLWPSTKPEEKIEILHKQLLDAQRALVPLADMRKQLVDAQQALQALTDRVQRIEMWRTCPNIESLYSVFKPEALRDPNTSKLVCLHGPRMAV